VERHAKADNRAGADNLDRSDADNLCAVDRSDADNRGAVDQLPCTVPQLASGLQHSFRVAAAHAHRAVGRELAAADAQRAVGRELAAADAQWSVGPGLAAADAVERYTSARPEQRLPVPRSERAG
jgi:hypothetical protein